MVVKEKEETIKQQINYRNRNRDNRNKNKNYQTLDNGGNDRHHSMRSPNIGQGFGQINKVIKVVIKMTYYHKKIQHFEMVVIVVQYHIIYYLCHDVHCIQYMQSYIFH